MHQIASELLNLDVDRYLNPWIPPNRLSLLPAPISRFLGYRKDPYKEPPTIITWIFTFIGAFTGILLVGAIYSFAPGVATHGPPVIVASLGASAVLDYNTIRSPLAQPRNAVLGHAFSAIAGVGISKLFQLNSDFQNIRWIAGAMSCACASLLMSMTNTVHPPGGATAVLAATDATVIAMGWWFIPVVMVGTSVMLAVALLLNNIMRQYPVYWWTPADVGRKVRHPETAAGKDAEKQQDAKAEQGSDASR